MNTIKSTIHTEAIFSDDEQHRYLLKKTWDKNKPACTVITMYPHLDGVLSLDLTTVLILNQLANVEQVMEMLKPHKKKVKKLINPATNEIMHPLNPKARQKWFLKA
ncbi:DUF1643 domain-containing protein [Staphylococcus equorum]|uniref:DUF1643 domain-containing protein n=1 Tax=Staphylococcus equorum TaxID=246432 RepID=UPI0025560180|nr:DUF1643 domain-containing protein [Staphylococcus equorum]MDK9859667.1 DUF1643 domain-containing protein [Staphylococcus equorum]